MGGFKAVDTAVRGRDSYASAAVCLVLAIRFSKMG